MRIVPKFPIKLSGMLCEPGVPYVIDRATGKLLVLAGRATLDEGEVLDEPRPPMRKRRQRRTSEE